MPKGFFAGEVCQKLLTGTVDIWSGFIPVTIADVILYSDVETFLLAYFYLNLRMISMNKQKG